MLSISCHSNKCFFLICRGQNKPSVNHKQSQIVKREWRTNKGQNTRSTHRAWKNTNPCHIGDRLVWAVRSSDLTHWATRAPMVVLRGEKIKLFNFTKRFLFIYFFYHWVFGQNKPSVNHKQSQIVKREWRTNKGQNTRSTHRAWKNPCNFPVTDR
jgi:hypothetical protein